MTKFFIKNFLIALIPAYLVLSCQAQVQEAPDQMTVDSLQEFYQKRLHTLLLKSPEISDYLTIHEKGLTLFSKTDLTQEAQAEYQLSWAEIARFQKYLNHAPHLAWQFYQAKKTPPPWPDSLTRRDSLQTLTDTLLRGARIALDPGHIAGNFKVAQMEGKYIEIPVKGKTVRFFESELNWYTAKILADRLQKAGAEVLLTRDAYDLTALDISFEEWYQMYIQENKLRKPNRQRVFFDTLRKLDFEARADKINAFRPHLTLIIHYNVDAANTGWRQPSTRNGSMAFVGGSFLKGELDEPQKRFHLLRLLLSDDLPQSIAFCQSILASLEENLELPPLRGDHRQSFIEKYCLYTGQAGVYARNLTLTRKVYGSLCYIEPLYQDNVQELLRLGQRDTDYQGHPISSRVVEVAEAYFQGILAHWQAYR